MAERANYYELYGELVRGKAFLQRLVMILLLINIILAVVCYVTYTRPAQTFVIKDGYAYTVDNYSYERSVHEVRRFCHEFAMHLLQFNKDNFNENVKLALQMCSQELEYLMYQTIKESDIPQVVRSTNGTIRFTIGEIRVKEGDPYKVRVTGQQTFPGQAPLDVIFDLEINVISRSQQNPFGLRIINFKQS